MSMKDLLNKITELQGTDTNEEVVSSTGKKVLTESAERPYVCVHAKKGKCEVTANSSYEAAKKAADKWKLKSTAGIDAYVADKPVSTASLEENTKPSLKNMFNALLAEAEQVTIQPAKQNTQVIKQGQKTLGTVENPQLAQQIKQSIGKGEMTLAGDELNEKWGEETKVAPSEKGKYEGKTKAELLKQYNALKASGPHKEGSSEYGKMRELAFAIRAKSGWGKVAETDTGEADARKTVISSPEDNEKVFAKHKERMNKLRDEDAKKKVDESKLNEKAVSKAQQQAAGAALAAKRGDAPKSKLKGASKEMVKMSTKELEKFAGTKHKGLPEKKQKTDEAAMPTHDGDFGAGLGAGRSQTTLEAKKTVKKDDKAEKAGKKVTKDIEYDEKVKDKIHGKKRKAEDDKAEKAGKKVAKDIEYDMKKKKVNESMNHNKLEAARLRGKAHALAKESYNCKYDEGTEERNAYHAGYKEGLDECYGMMPIQGLVVGEEMPATVPGMASAAMEADVDEGNAFTAALAKTPKGGKFTVGGKTFTDRTSYDAKVDEMDMMAFESWDRELNALLNEGKMKDIDIDMKEMSDAEFKKEHGKSKADMKKDLSGSTDKKEIKEGLSVSVSKGQQGVPDSVTVTAQDGEADALLAMIKQAGLGLFGDDKQASDYGAPLSPETDVTIKQKSEVGDHDDMMSLIKKMSTSPSDYEDEEAQDDDHVHGHPDSACGCATDEKDVVVGEDESEDQMEFEVAEANAPDSDQAETTADEDAEAEEDKALAGADSGDEEEIDEAKDYCDSCDRVASKCVCEQELNEWANDAGYEGSENMKDNTFEQDIEFMTKVISGGLNGQKQDQTTLPHTKVKVEESDSIADWKKLSGIR